MTENNKARKEFQPTDLEGKNDDEYENAVCKGIRECLTGLNMQILNDYGSLLKQFTMTENSQRRFVLNISRIQIIFA